MQVLKVNTFVSLNQESPPERRWLGYYHTDLLECLPKIHYDSNRVETYSNNTFQTHMLCKEVVNFFIQTVSQFLNMMMTNITNILKCTRICTHTHEWFWSNFCKVKAALLLSLLLTDSVFKLHSCLWSNLNWRALSLGKGRKTMHIHVCVHV